MIVAFTHYKGGTGKTTSCLSIAGYLARYGKKVLAIDMDPQGNLTSGFGIDKSTLDTSMKNIMNRGGDIRKIIIKTLIKNIHLAPSNQELVETNLKTYRGMIQARILKKSLERIREQYDFILIDTPPVYNHFIINGIEAADKIILVLDPGIFALEGIETLKKAMGGFFEKLDIKNKMGNPIVTRCNIPLLPWKKNIVGEIKRNIEGILERRAFLIPYSDHIYESHRKGLPISHYKPYSKVGKAYDKVALELLKEKRKND